MAKGSCPRCGSMAFYPKKRAKRIYPNMRAYKHVEQAKLSAFPVYKAGMLKVIALDGYDKSPSYGMQVAIAGTVVECPPVYVFGIRGYQKTNEGLKAISEFYAEKLNKELGRKMMVPEKYDFNAKKSDFEKTFERITEFRAMVQTQPKKIGLKKKPETVEIPITGKDKKTAFDYAISILGKEINMKELFAEGDYIDVIGITKGKGYQGPVKRFGIKIQIRKAKGHRRMPGSLGAWHPARVLYTVAMGGQLGYQRRTELNKQIIKLGENGKEATPAGGFTNYGEIAKEYAIIKGSLPGPKKRMILIRGALRSNKSAPAPKIIELRLEGQN
ncbi:MAG: 50S ribosomal protein L3 [Candidatus Micrarchaeota archaeon]